jgi:hypothetical protein
MDNDLTAEPDAASNDNNETPLDVDYIREYVASLVAKLIEVNVLSRDDAVDIELRVGS